jgi:ribonuclease G
VLEDGQVAEVYLERPGRRSIAGNVYKGIVDNVLPGMEAAFVDIGLEKNGFLYVDEIVGAELEGRRQGRRIQDLLARGQEILVQAVKDPMKSKGARLTTEISLPGRFVVYVPQGEGVGVSRRLEEEERGRLREILKGLSLPKGGIIVRTAAEGASAEDVERDLLFLERLWKEIQARAKALPAPALVYQEAELPLRVVRDLFTGDFERALVDDELTLKRLVGYLKKTSPHMAERVQRYRERTPLLEAYGVEAEIRSTLNRRVDLPSGGYLVFDYAEAFTVIDVNTGRFVGSRSKSSGARLEETVTKNNLEAVREVVRQLRLRDIGGIIVIDFIDMANPKNRQQVEEALKRELERDRTKTYVVEISPLGLVEMTRQNVTEGPREILTKPCPTCAGEGLVVSEFSAAVEAERRLRALAAESPRAKAFQVELNARTAEMLVGPGADRLLALEAATKRRFFLERREDVPLDHFLVVAKGTVEELAPQAPVAEGEELQLKLVEVGLYDPQAGVGKVDGYEVAVAAAAKLVGKRVRVRVQRALAGTAYATLAEAAEERLGPVTAEGFAERPTRARRRLKAEEAPPPRQGEEAQEGGEELPGAEELVGTAAAAEEPKTAGEPEGEEATASPRRRRRGSRGGRGRRKTALAAEPAVEQEELGESAAPPRIHVPPADLGLDDGLEEQALPAAREVPLAVGALEAGAGSDNGLAAEAPPRKRTRRGSRGGRGRRKRSEAAASLEPAEPGVDG